MFKSIVIAAALVITSAAQASNSVAGFLFEKQISTIQQNIKTFGPNWAVGDTCDYKLNMGGFLNGTMKMYVREIGADGMWIVQEVDMMIQKQTVEMLLDTATGEVKKVLVDGREQSLPESDPEIIEQKEANVTVPAGTYQSIYLKIKDNAQNGAISEMWVNPRDIPISGMLKSIQDSQLGKVTIELVSFIKK